MPHRHDPHPPQADRRRHTQVTADDLEREIEQLAGQLQALEKQIPSADEIKHWRAMAEADKRRAWLITLTLKVAGTVTAVVVIWTAYFDDAEVMSLARGFSPRRVRPQSLKLYAPMVRDLQATYDAKSGGGHSTWTTSGSPIVSAHPRSYGF